MAEKRQSFTALPPPRRDKILLEKIAVMVVTSAADRLQIYSERVRNLSGLNHTKLEQDGGNSVRLIQDLLQA